MTVENPRHMVAEDRKLANLVSAVMEDPNLHTDLRMQLGAEIRDLVRTAPQPHGTTRHLETPRRATEAAGGQVADLVQAVPSDPNLHTDTR
ncbi:MAG: hypothetical protein JO244_03165, partial [Solirubrobacterales bacterium]|nr:hypothetical protein [Solirubrobacterales bacterium]